MTATLAPDQRKHIIIGTAGHVDHGKTTLVKALTGVDTDRLPEEKEREMTIDLGFARFELPGGQQAAIVDVPGHERFIGNMLAGATGIDLVLLVIAADEGVMPQTREHLDILELLGLTTGIVVLTKSDLVDQELLDVVALEVREALAGTFLEDAPVLAVSARTGHGLAQLLAACSAAVQGAGGKPASGPARLPVDRAFTAPGFGTIVTGTLVSGVIAVDDRLELLPQGREVRVRGLEVHGERRGQVSAGERVAANLAGVARDEVWRGMVIAASGAFQSTMHFDAELRLLPRVPRPLRSGQRLHLHTGTSEVLVRVVLLEQASLAPGSTGLVQLHAESPLVLGPRDRFIVRQYSPVETLGGGVVLDASPQWRRRRPRGPRSEALRHRLIALRRGSPDEVALSLIAGMEDGFAVPARQAVEDRLRSELSLDEAGVTALLTGLTASARLIALPGGGYMMSAARWQRAAGAAHDFLAAYHVRWPLRPGATREELRAGALGSPPPRVFAAQFEMLIQDQVIIQRHDRLALPDFQPQLHGGHLREADRIRTKLAAAGASPPSRGELAPDQEVLDYLVRSGEVVRLTDDLYYGHAQLHEVSRLLRGHLQERGEVTVSDFRQLVGTTRKYAVPLLEYFDQQRITQRQGDVRVAGALAAQPKQSFEVK